MATDKDTPSFPTLYESINDKLRAIAAVANLLGQDENTDQIMLDAANHACRLASDAKGELERLWERHSEEYEKKAQAETDAPREWTGASADLETKALGARILALPDYAVKQVMDFALNVATAHRTAEEPNQITIAEIGSMLKRGSSLRGINDFWHLKLNGLATMVPEAEVPKSLEDLEHEIAHEIEDIRLTIEQNDLALQEDVTRDYLVDIGAKAKELAAMLNDLCNTEHVSAPGVAS